MKILLRDTELSDFTDDDENDSDYDPMNPKQNINISFTIDEEYLYDEEYETYSDEDDDEGDNILTDMSQKVTT